MKIKRALKYLLPILVVVGVVICFLVSRMKQPTGRDNVLTGNVDLPQDDNGNYIAQRYESNLIPSDTGFTVNDQPVDNVIRVDDGESGEDSDYILVEIEEQDVKELFKKEDLLNGHPTTNQNTVITEDIIKSEDIVYNETYTDLDPIIGMPEALAYDTEITKRTQADKEAYLGMLYGKWTYAFSVEDKDKYNLTTALVIASHYQGIVLSEVPTGDNATTQTVLTNGSICEVLSTPSMYDDMYQGGN